MMNDLSTEGERPLSPRGLATPVFPKDFGAEAVADSGEAGTSPILMKYVEIALRRKWFIIGSVAGVFILGLIVTLMMTPLYSASATLEISRESSRVVEIQGVEADTNPGDIEFYQTQYGLLQARSLAERIVRDLRLADNPAFFEMFGKSPDGEEANGAASLSSANRAERIRLAGEILLDNVSVTPVRLSRLVEITFTSPDPTLSAQITNAWASHFIESNLERRFEATSYARNFLEGRLEQLRKRLEESERQLVAYASNQRIINLPTAPNAAGVTSERSLLADDLAALNSELTQANADRIKARSRLTNQSPTGSSAEALANGALTTLRERRADVASEYAKILVQFEPEYPAARALASQIEQLDKSIAREEARVQSVLQGDYQSSIARAEALDSSVNQLKAGLLDLRRRSIQYNIYQREVDTNRQLYDGLLQRYKEIGVAGGVGTNNVSIVDRAEVPNQPSRPNLILNLLIALILGTLLGVALALILEQLDDAISDPGEIGRLLKLPVLGTVPKSKDQSLIAAINDRKSSIVEAYLSVQTNLEFSTDHGVPRSLSVTSTRPAEGKSTTAFAIAHALARAKHKVILVDGDMRSPSVHHFFEIDNAVGLSNFLSGNVAIADLVRPAPLEGLTIMTAGPQPPNAAELLTGPRFEQLLRLLLQSHDHVVVDSPPVMGLADAPLIASRVEGVIFAVESHGIRARVVRVALSRLQAANANILGTVLTKFQAKRAHFGYGYDYGYGYGETDKKPI